MHNELIDRVKYDGQDENLAIWKVDQLARACDQLAASTASLRGSCLRFSSSWSVGLPDNGFFALRPSPVSGPIVGHFAPSNRPKDHYFSGEFFTIDEKF